MRLLNLLRNKMETNIIEQVGEAADKNFTTTEERIKANTENTANARKLQESALQQEDKFSKRAIYYLAYFWSIIAASYIFAITFIEIPAESQRIADTVTGFLLGTIIATIINFFFGSSHGSKLKTEQNDGFFKKLLNK